MNAHRIKDSMTRSLVSIRWDSPIREARDLMLERGIRHLPVEGDNKVLAGILSDRDVKRAMDPDGPRFRPGAVAADYMTWPVLTVDESTPLVKALERMLSEKISALIVTREKEGDAGRMGETERVGIITTEDMLHVLHELLLVSENQPVLDLTYEPLWREVMRTASSVGL